MTVANAFDLATPYANTSKTSIFCKDNQQKLARMTLLALLHLTQIRCESWQLSTIKGIQHKIPVNHKRQQHHKYVTVPGFFIRTVWVLSLQNGHPKSLGLLSMMMAAGEASFSKKMST